MAKPRFIYDWDYPAPNDFYGQIFLYYNSKEEKSIPYKEDWDNIIISKQWMKEIIMYYYRLQWAFAEYYIKKEFK